MSNCNLVCRLGDENFEILLSKTYKNKPGSRNGIKNRADMAKKEPIHVSQYMEICGQGGYRIIQVSFRVSNIHLDLVCRLGDEKFEILLSKTCKNKPPESMDSMVLRTEPIHDWHSLHVLVDFKLKTFY